MRWLAWLLTFLLAPTGLLGCTREVGPTNVVLVTIDTLRADHLAHFGYPRDTSRGLDRFRDHATLFTEAYANAPWTGPSVASLLTGLTTARHRANRHRERLPESAYTLAERLRDAGWTTHGISWNVNVSERMGFAQGFDDFVDVHGRAQDYPDIAELRAEVEQRLDAGLQEPFFLYLHPMNVHGPYRVPPESKDVLLGRAPDEAFVYYGPLMSAIVKHKRFDQRGLVTRAIVESLIEQYDTAIRYTSDELGRLFERLEREGLYDRSLVIVLSDHGEELFDHGGFSHGYSLHRELLHVPLYVKLPYQRSPRTVDVPVSLIDVLPTVLELAGIPQNGAIDGQSLVALLGARTARTPYVQTPLLHETAWRGRAIGRALHHPPFKLIEMNSSYDDPAPRTLLFRVAEDRAERDNLAGRLPDVTRELQRQLRKRHAAHHALSLTEADRVPIAPGERKKLEALGYVD